MPEHLLQSFDLYSGKLVIDSFWIVKLVQICYGLVVQLVVDLLWASDVADMLWTCLVIYL